MKAGRHQGSDCMTDSTNQYRNGSIRLSRISIIGSIWVTLRLRCFWDMLIETAMWRYKHTFTR